MTKPLTNAELMFSAQEYFARRYQRRTQLQEVLSLNKSAQEIDDTELIERLVATVCDLKAEIAEIKASIGLQITE